MPNGPPAPRTPPARASIRSALKWTARGLVALALLIGLAVHALWVRLHHSLPQIEGTIALEGLTAPVDVLRDRYGVPHIFAESERDAFFALGFVHAQDRLFQMDFARRTGQGRLAELLGPRARAADRLIRSLDLGRASERALAHVPEPARRALEAYAQGVNAFLTWNTRPLPPEFTLLGYRPEPWRPADSILIVKLLALQLSTNAFGELFHAALLGAQGPAAFAALFPDLTQPLPRYEQLYDLPSAQAPSQVPAPTPGGATNNWVVDGRLTATGKPLLANDPHLSLTMPSIWYLAHLDYEGRPFIGATIAGVPGIILGRNDRIAWGYSNTGGDVQDLFLERLNPQSPNEYLTPTGYRPFETREETMRVRFAGEERFTVRMTRHGPVLPLEGTRLPSPFPEGHVLAMAWPALDDTDGTMAAGLALMKAESCEGFFEAMRTYVAPMQNMVCADRDGHTGFIAPALVPVRAAENDTLGLVPAPGWDAKYDWTGFIPFTGLPQARDPAQGFIVTANNRIVPQGYPYLISLEWESDERARRIEALIAESRSHSVESFAAMQMDEVSLTARELMPALLAALQHVPPKHRTAGEAVRLLANWDGTMRADRPEPLIFTAFVREATRSLLVGKLGEDLLNAFWLRGKFLLRAVMEGEPEAVTWCKDIAGDASEACARILSGSFDRALASLVAEHGRWPQRWRWGRPHEARFAHRLGAYPLFGRLLSRHVPSGGGFDTINRGQMYFSTPYPYANVHGAGYRAVYDLDNPEASVFINSTGQSGNPLSPYYDNLIEAWAHGTYLPMTTARDALEESGVHTLRLVPRSDAEGIP